LWTISGLVSQADRDLNLNLDLVLDLDLAPKPRSCRSKYVAK